MNDKVRIARGEAHHDSPDLARARRITDGGEALSATNEEIREIARALLSSAEREQALQKALSAALGYLMNASIDLQTGAPKKTALATIKGGISLVSAALSPKPQERSDV